MDILDSFPHSTVLLKKFQSLPDSESFDRMSLPKVRSEALFSSTWWNHVSYFAAVRSFCRSEQPLPDQCYAQTLYFLSIFILEATLSHKKSKIWWTLQKQFLFSKVSKALGGKISHWLVKRVCTLQADCFPTHATSPRTQ